MVEKIELHILLVCTSTNCEIHVETLVKED